MTIVAPATKPTSIPRATAMIMFYFVALFDPCERFVIGFFTL